MSIVGPAVATCGHLPSRRSYEHLLQAGVNLYEWEQGVPRSKIAVVDDWCTVGTHNLDYRSWLYNLEINVSMVHAALCRELSDRIEQAIVVSQRIDHNLGSAPALASLAREVFAPLS